MSYAPINGTGNGTAPVVNLTWPFILQTDVQATVNGSPAAFTWTGAAQITFSAVVGSGVAWQVYRQTSVDAPSASFTDNSVLTAAALNAIQNQELYREQELAQPTAGAAALSANNGANLIGFSDSVSYSPGTVGFQIKNQQVLTDLTKYVQLTGTTWPYKDLIYDQVEHGVQNTGLVTNPGPANFFTPFWRATYLAAGHVGGLQTGMFIGQVRGAPGASSTNLNYTPLQTEMSATTNLGGTGLTMGTGKGAIFGGSLLGVLYSGATYILNLTGGEINVQASAGTSVVYKSGLQISAMPSDAVQGSIYDASLSLSNQAGAIGFKVGVLFSNANGAFPVTTTGTLIGVMDSPTLGTAIDLTGATITANIITATNVNLTAAGQLKVGKSNVASSAIGIHFLSSGATAGAYDSALLGFGGGGALGAGGISVAASLVQPASDNNTGLGTTNQGWSNVYAWQYTIPERTAASVTNPSAGAQVLFIDSVDHKLKRKDSTGTVTIIA